MSPARKLVMREDMGSFEARHVPLLEGESAGTRRDDDAAPRHDGGVHLVVAVAFGVTAMAGLGFALLGPVAMVRMLGFGAFALSVIGVVVQAYALREFHPGTYRDMMHRVDTWRDAAFTRTASLRTPDDSHALVS